MRKLKYEGKFGIGDKIKALDFVGNNDYWIAGKIIATSTVRGAKVFEIKIEEDTMAERAGDSRVGDIGYVPMESFPSDKIVENRVTLY